MWATAAVTGWPALLLLLLLAAVRPVRADVRYDHHLTGTSMAWPCRYDPRAVIHSRFQMTREGRVIVASPRFRPGVPFTLGSFRATVASRAVVEPDVLPLPPVPEMHSVPAPCNLPPVAPPTPRRPPPCPPRCPPAGPKTPCTLPPCPTTTTTPTTPPQPSCLSSCAKSSYQLQQPPPYPPLINVVDLCLDGSKDVLWLLDVGVVDTMTDRPVRVAPAKIVRLDLEDEEDPRTYKTYEIGTDPATAMRSCLQYIVTFRSRAAGGGHYVFVSDASHSAVLAINTDTGVQWTIDFPERSNATDAPRDVLFIVTLRTADGRTGLYATFLSGCRMFAVDLERIDECAAAAAAASGVTGAGRPPVVEVGQKPYRITVLGTDTGSRMFFRRPAENEVWSWDVNGPFHPVGFQLVSRGRDCRAPAHVAPGYGGFVFVLKNNFGDYARNRTGSLGAYTIVEPLSILPPAPCDDAQQPPPPPPPPDGPSD